MTIKKLPTGCMVSHLDWFSKEKILAFSNLKKNQQYSHSVFSIVDGDVYTIQHPSLSKDGHPTAISENTFYTDTYPDKRRFQTLYEVNFSGLNYDVKQILKLRSPMRFRGANRVDLHPRLSVNGTYLSLDSSFSGMRKQIVLYK